MGALAASGAIAEGGEVSEAGVVEEVGVVGVEVVMVPRAPPRDGL
jgi:hypothetical protein